ncbi:MAG: hypothetical protein ACI9VM_000606 [Candidatus Azotimanducaceae bacterium]|jgi:hypothetical protein
MTVFKGRQARRKIEGHVMGWTPMTAAEQNSSLGARVQIARLRKG